MRKAPVHRFIPGPEGRLEALYHPPLRPVAVVVCHPHPHFGGSMRNKVVYWMARAFSDLGYGVVRFNYRGVGRSEGVSLAGKQESKDVSAVVDWLASQHSECDLWVAGFSYGAYVGLLAGHRDGRVSRLFAVAPPVSRWDFAFMEENTKPLTVVGATEDELVPFSALKTWARSVPMCNFRSVEGADHFFHGKMDRMIDALLSGIHPLEVVS